MRRLWPVLLLVPLGVVAGHQVVYAALHSHAWGMAHGHAHGHLALLTTLAFPLAVTGAAWLARRANRDLILPALATLAGVQGLAFVGMEAAERLTGGGDLAALARSPLLWAGVAAQIATALAFGLTLRGAARMATVLLRRTTTSMVRCSPVAPVHRPTGRLAPRPLAVTRWLLRRGPPALLGP